MRLGRVFDMGPLLSIEAREPVVLPGAEGFPDDASLVKVAHRLQW